MARGKTKTTGTGKGIKYSLTASEKDEFTTVLIANNFNITKACRESGIERAVYYYLLKYDIDFKERLDWSQSFLSNIVKNGLIEGLMHADLTLRYKYLDLLAKSGTLAKLLGLSDGATDLSSILNGKKITLV